MADPRLAQTPTIVGAVRVGVVDFEIAPLGTLYSADSSFERLGTLSPGSFKLNGERTMFNYERGLPKNMINSYAIGQKGTLAMDLDEITSRAIEVANGGMAPVRTLTGNTTVSAAPTPTTTTFTVAAIGTIVVNSWISITLAATGVTYDRKVTAVSGSQITVDALPQAPSTGDTVGKITSIQVPGGGVQTVNRTGRMVFTDNWGDKFITYFPKIQTSGKFSFDPKDGQQNAILPIEFNLYGVQTTINSVTDVFLYHSYFLPGA